MKSFYKRLNVITLIFFILGIIFSAYQLYNFPSAIEQQSPSVTPATVEEITPVMQQLNFIVGITLALGLVTLIFSIYLLNFSKESERIVYVEKSEKQKKDEKEQDENKDKQFDENALKEIKETVGKKRTLQTKGDALLSTLCNKLEASQGIIYRSKKQKTKRTIELFAAYAFSMPDSESLSYEFGEGLAGQAAKEGKVMNIKDVPEGYLNIISGLGNASPRHLMIYPVKSEEGEVDAVLEIASFREFTKVDENLIQRAAKMLEDELKNETSKSKGNEATTEKKKSD